MQHPGRAKGFSLLEILVAFVLASSSLGLLYTIQSNARKAIVSSEEQSIAIELLQSLLAESRTPLADLSQEASGTHNGKYYWHIGYAPYNSPVLASDQPSQFALAKVSIEVEWLSGSQTKSLSVQTLQPTTDTYDD